MIKTQRIIKYISIGFALCLTINIISMIMFGIISICNIFIDNNEVNNELENQEIIKQVEFIEIDIENSNIFIKQGEEFKTETNDKDILIKEDANKLIIIEENKKWLNKENTDLIIYIPLEYRFKEVLIENGAGKVHIDALQTDDLEIDLGVGDIVIENLTVTKSANIDNGVGDITISNGNVYWLDTDIGIGHTSITASIHANAEISTGIGDFEFNLLEDQENYKIIVDAGISKATLNGKKIKKGTYYGDGPNLIDISGGIGNIKVNTN